MIVAFRDNIHLLFWDLSNRVFSNMTHGQNEQNVDLFFEIIFISRFFLKFWITFSKYSETCLKRPLKIDKTKI